MRRTALLALRRGAAARGPVGTAAAATRSVRRFAAAAAGEAPADAGTRFAGVVVAGFAASAAVLTLSSTPVAKADAAPPFDKAKVVTAIEELVEKGHGPLFVRLAWHAAGTYDKASGTGGSEGGLMRFAPEANFGANKGLDLARNLLEPVKKAHPGITYADLYTLCGAVAIEYMGGPAIPWRPGRTDHADGSKGAPDGRLPAADKGSLRGTVQHLRDVFYRMGFNDREIVALSGAHTLGRCHTDRSGYWGPWTRAETTFSNLYFTELLQNRWTLKRWAGPDQFEDPTGELMMLPSDMALLWDKNFRSVAEQYAKDDTLFFKDFAAAFSKLLELGVPALKKGWF